MLGYMLGFMLGSMYDVNVRMFVDIFIGKYVGMQPTHIPKFFLDFYDLKKKSFYHKKLDGFIVWKVFFWLFARK